QLCSMVYSLCAVCHAGVASMSNRRDFHYRDALCSLGDRLGGEFRIRYNRRSAGLAGCPRTLFEHKARGMSGLAHGLDPIDEFEDHYQKYQLQVYRTIRAIVLEPATAEDLTQETFERAFKRHRHHGDVESIGAFLHRIAVNTAISHLRRQNLARLLPMRLFLGSPPSAFEHAEARTL